MEIKLQALALKSVDYKDNDKMLSLYSLEKGLIGVGVKGVKKAGAKLAFCTQPFCFAEYVVSVKNDRMTVISATETESFYKLRLDIKTFYAASAITEYLLKCTQENLADEKMFILALNCLKQLNFAEKSPAFILTSFLYQALKLSGYGISADVCKGCFKEADKFTRAFFDFEEGSLYCEKCATFGMREILPLTAKALTSLEKHTDVLEDAEIYLIKFLIFYLKNKTGENIYSANELIKLCSVT